jgi:tripartite-type tricarboxylate transporter receptor subunit TctC
MELPRRRNFLHLVAGAAALPVVSRVACAQAYPSRPVKIVVPVGPSGSYDIVGRTLADQLAKRLEQTVVVENRPGAGTVVGTQAVIQSPADGYTLLIGGLSNIVFNVGLYNKPPYDPLKDLVPVALVFNVSYTLIGSTALPYALPKEIVAAAKRNPGKLTFATVGVGSGQHIVGAAFMKVTGTQLLDVPYRGPALAYPDILSGRIDLFFDSTPSALNYIKSGQVRGIGILTAKRNPQAPNVPTMTESGVPGLEIDSWIGLFAPTGTPPAAIARLQQAITKSMPELRQRFEAAGGELMEAPPDWLNGIIKADYDRWIAIIREAGIRLE